MDWSGFAGLAVDVTNPGTETVRFALRVEDAPHAKGSEHGAFGIGAIEPGTTASFVLKPAEKPPLSFGMQALPPVPGMRTMANLAKEALDFSHVYGWQVYLSHPSKPHTLIFDNVRLVAVKSASLDKIVDRFGQYAAAEWPGKLHDEKEFAVRRTAEEHELRLYPGAPARDRFGGWTGGPQLPPGKFFRTQQLAGKWWLVDPDGHLFLSFGVNTVFRDAVAAQLEKVVTACKDDPWCIGYFIDNELSWGSAKAGDPKLRYALALGALKAQADASPAKKALLAQLQQTYSDIGQLNAAWKTSVAGWDALTAPAAPFGPAVEADFQRYQKAFATQYFTVVSTELHRLDPHHLYLGCRFANFTPECVQAAAEICDGLSFNIYRQRLDKEWDFLKSITKPVIIGEFHIGATDRGMFNPGLVEAANQQLRAAMVQDYVRSVADHPSFIGCHWFRYDDEPLLGHTANGENFNIGLVSITDTPYPELIAAFRSVLTDAYPRRYQAAGRTVQPPR